jgi:hypothetical protein
LATSIVTAPVVSVDDEDTLVPGFVVVHARATGSHSVSCSVNHICETILD